MMFRKVVILVSVFLLGSLCASCAMYKPQHFFDYEYVNLNLNQPNFKVVASAVQASAEGGVLLPFPTASDFLAAYGLGPFEPSFTGIPLDPTNLLDQAMAKVHGQYGMEGRSMQFHNTTVEWTQKNYIVYGKRKVTITTDVIEYTGEHMDYRPRTSYQATSYHGTSYEEPPSSAAPETKKQKQSKGRRK